MCMPKNILLSLLTVTKLVATLISADGECHAPTKVVCKKIVNPPTLDGDLSDWAEIENVTSAITTALGAVVYPHGDMAMKCTYDEENIYMAISVPGPYRFDSTDDHLCAAISTMMKMGEKAEFVNMGACPDAMSGCPLSIPVSCKDYTVDVGAHWELKTTEQGVLYAKDIETESGNDPIANKDDEVAVSSYCRVDDSGENSGNEWAGAWVHNVDTSDPTNYTDVDGTDGTYVFEMSRSLTTTSPETDAQLAENSTYKFGIAYWDPYQTDTIGWTKVGHYVTGCSEEWMDLVIGSDPSTEYTTSGSASIFSPTMKTLTVGLMSASIILTSDLFF